MAPRVFHVGPPSIPTSGPPINYELPVVTGDLIEGATLTCDPGAWAGSAPITYEFQWMQAVTNEAGEVLTDIYGRPIGVVIPDATDPTYVVGGIAPVIQTWNPDDKSAGITLTDGDNTFTPTSDLESVRSIAAVAVDQEIYVEFKIVTRAFQIILGFADLAEDLSTQPGTSYPPLSFGIRANGGTFVQGGSSLDSTAVVTSFGNDGDDFDLAYSRPLGLIWGRTNNGPWNDQLGGTQDPATGQGGIPVHETLSSFLYVMGMGRHPGDSCTMRMPSADWQRTPPAGFTAGGE